MTGYNIWLVVGDSSVNLYLFIITIIFHYYVLLRTNILGSLCQKYEMKYVFTSFHSSS